MGIKEFLPPSVDGTPAKAKAKAQRPAPAKAAAPAEPALRWDDRLNLGVAEIDGQHQTLVGYCNVLVAAIQKGQGQAAVTATLTRLRDYTTIHFAAEERYMEQIGYPDLPAHREAHADMVRRVKEFQRRIYQHEDPAPAEVRAFLKDWLITHILGVDRKIAAFLKAQAAAPQEAPPAAEPEPDAAGPADPAPGD